MCSILEADNVSYEFEDFFYSLNAAVNPERAFSRAIGLNGLLCEHAESRAFQRPKTALHTGHMAITPALFRRVTLDFCFLESQHAVQNKPSSFGHS